MTTGILYDRVTPLASLQDFNKPAADTSSYWHFIQAYSELYRSAYSRSTWSTVKDIQGQVLADKIQGIVPVGLGNYQLNVIDTNALSN